ncbi:MAG: NUDIX hydrolase [Deltaproteobacteria bacterium]|nr:NUDIX hydrolase [Deltaproteobacteria bacterium]
MPTYKYPRPALTVDCVIFGVGEDDLKVLLIQRDLEPFAGQWALPGGFVNMEEDLQDAALRELHEETGLQENVPLQQLFTFGDVGRDPRGRTVSVVYYASVKISEHPLRAGSDAQAADWFPAQDTPTLAFDHAKILRLALEVYSSRQ